MEVFALLNTEEAILTNNQTNEHCKVMMWLPSAEKTRTSNQIKGFWLQKSRLSGKQALAFAYQLFQT